jgi:hypothetical protein
LQRFALQNFAHTNICNDLHTLGLAAHPSVNLIISKQKGTHANKNGNKRMQHHLVSSPDALL